MISLKKILQDYQNSYGKMSNQPHACKFSMEKVFRSKMNEDFISAIYDEMMTEIHGEVKCGGWKGEMWETECLERDILERGKCFQFMFIPSIGLFILKLQGSQLFLSVPFPDFCVFFSSRRTSSVPVGGRRQSMTGDGVGLGLVKELGLRKGKGQERERVTHYLVKMDFVALAFEIFFCSFVLQCSISLALVVFGDHYFLFV